MQLTFTDLTAIVLCLIAGGMIGCSFGMIQERARRRHEKLAQAGTLKENFGAMPGSMRRVGYLLIALALVQLVCPLLFTSARQWWVSGGVIAGYGYILYRQLRERLAHPSPTQ